MADYDKENDKDIFAGFDDNDDDDEEADRESRQNVIKFNNNCPSALILINFLNLKTKKRKK